MMIPSTLPLAAALSLACLTPGLALASPMPREPVAAQAAGDAKPVEIARRGRGADDGPNHDKNDDRGRRGRGHDDGPRKG